jgi:hypothetical protein
MTERTNTVQAETKEFQILLPDAASTADAAIQRAIEFSTEKMRLGNHAAALEKLRANDPAACAYCLYSIAQQVGIALGALDEHVLAAYVVDYDATPEDLCFASPPQTPLIHMILRVARKTSALTALVEALDRALMRAYAQVLGDSRREHLLDVQVVTEEEVARRVGYGALLTSIHQRPLCLWER